MKMIKRIAMMLLAICLIVPCFSTIALAAEGVIFFDDLETKVGDTFVIEGTVVAKNDILGEASVELSYDSSYLRFVEGDGVTESGNGKLTFTGEGDGSGDRVKFKMSFQALQEGSTRVTQGQATVTTQSGESVVCEEGYSDVKIAEGDPSKIQPEGKTTSITISGVEYTLSEAFDENSIPEGFTVGELTYEGETYKCAVQESSGLYVAYLVDSENNGKFWLYNADEVVFYPFEEIIISDEYSIVVLDGSDKVKLPSKYIKSSMEINGTEFTVWADSSREGFYVLYAVNNNGEKSLYLYDSQEHTYQRMETPKSAAAATDTTKKATGVFDKIEEFVTTYLVWVLVAVGCILVILLVFLIVTAIKLRHRNLELDDLYDEYGIENDKESAASAQSKKKSQFKKPIVEEKDEAEEFFGDDDFDDDFDDDDDDYDDDEFEEDFDDQDELAELRSDYTSAAPESKNLNFDDYYDDDDFDDEFEEDFDAFGKDTSRTQTRSDDTFEMDFIDLD